MHPFERPGAGILNSDVRSVSVGGTSLEEIRAATRDRLTELSPRRVASLIR
jgi:hypothetical protein